MKYKPTPTPASVWRNPIHFAAFGFGVGAIKFAPGTWGTLLAVPLYLLVKDLSLLAYLGVIIVLFMLGVMLCHKTAQDIGIHDHPGIVWDEIVGFLITMTAIPAGWIWILVGFGLFRLFDIWKPWPIRIIDKKVSGGFGIMLDDLLAACFAWAIIQTIALGINATI